jgi:hypothetical protein
LALVDAKYKFTIIYFSGYGKSSDGGLFHKINFGKIAGRQYASSQF